MPAPAIRETEARLLEVFSSIQGEGLLVGCRQIFVRMAECNLDCRYCDTPFQPLSDCRIEDAPSSGNFRNLPNPVSLETLYNVLHGWDRSLPGVHHSISFTGGEPLVQGDILEEWLPTFRKILPIYLETNGTLPDQLQPLIPHLDWIAMDVKLASLTGVPTPWEAHREFLLLARSSRCQVKMVIGEATTIDELETAARLMRDHAADVPLILQPLTENGRIAPNPATLLQMQTVVGKIHSPVRVIPQVHRFSGFI